MRIFILFVLLFPLVSHASNSDGHSASQRPTVALVLAGGGAKGAAHIGVLKRLEELRIPVDYIAGTSIGSYVGGLYATGLSASEIETLFSEQDWSQGYADRIERGKRSVHSKGKGDRYQIHLDLGITLGSINAPNGVIQGQSMLSLLRTTTGNITHLESFDELAIPFRSIATNISTMEQEVIGSGYLPDAMMASMSIPALLPPFKMNGKYYIDGGVTNNMPILAAKKMGADVIIAVDVSSSYKPQDEMDGMVDMLNQLSIHMVKRSTDLQVNALTVRDLYLKPEVGHIETTDFAAMPYALEQGYKSALDVSLRLSELRVSATEYDAYLTEKSQKRSALIQKHELRIDHIRFVNQSQYATQTLYHHLDLIEGYSYTQEELETAIERIYALDSFEVVRYTVEKEGLKNTMVIAAQEKSWGPNYLDFRLHVEEDFDKNSIYSIGAVTHLTHLSVVGTEAWLGVDLGTTKRIDVEVLQPLIYGSKLTLGTGLHYLSDKGNVEFSESSPVYSLDVNDEDYIPYTNKAYKGELELNINPALWHELTFGYGIEQGETSLTPMPSLGCVDYSRHGFYSEYTIDTLDDLTFPREGLKASLSWHQYQDEYDITEQGRANSETNEFTSTVRYVSSVNKHTLDTKFEFGLIDTENDALALSPLRLGGFLNLSGVSRNSLAGKEKAFGSITYRYQWVENDFGLFQSPVYLGASLEQGAVWQDTEQSISDIDMYRSNAVFMGVDSPLGVVILSYSKVHSEHSAVYLIIGSAFP